LHTLELYTFANLRDLKGLEQANSLHTLTLSGLDNLRDLKGLEQADSLRTLTLSNLANLRDLKGLEQPGHLIVFSLTNISENGLSNSQFVLTVPTDTLFLKGVNINNMDFRKETCKSKVIIYQDVAVNEDWIVKMAKSAPQTKFLNRKDFGKDPEVNVYAK
ncbi:MAG: hypothetical protein LH606_16135, partial [Cytophagaceae bacterium]|nr:hypothetical protein [Cytophagaceae bacterium]